MGAPPVDFDEGETAALEALAGSGLVPPLRLVVPVEVVDRARERGDPAAEAS